jgi:hypothetical protein
VDICVYLHDLQHDPGSNAVVDALVIHRNMICFDYVGVIINVVSQLEIHGRCVQINGVKAGPVVI